MTVQSSDRRTRGAAASSDPVITIGEMARTFEVSLRTLRFYEDRGLLVPRRVGTARFYTSRDKSRLQAILRLKQLGFTLTEIRDMIAEQEKRPTASWIEVALRPDQVVAQIAHLERQREEIEGAIEALRTVQKTFEPV